MFWKIRYFFIQIRRFIKWIPIHWDHVDNDYTDAIEVFRFQLLLIADRLEKNTHSENAKQYARRIRVVTDLMQKVYNEEYGREYMKEIEKLYGKRELVFNKIEASCLYELELKYDKDYSAEELEKINQHEGELRGKAEQKQKRAHKLLWELVEHNIHYWWD